MEATSSMDTRRMHATAGGNAGFARIEILVELAVSGCRFIARQWNAFIKARRQAQARAELRHLSDHYLRDIGLDRQQIDRLFR